MINREDMLELTRRMTLTRTSLTRIAGCYVDRDGDFDGSFNTNFLKLSASDRKKNLEIAKAVLFADTDAHLTKYKFDGSIPAQVPIRQLLTALKECGLKNDALLDTFYDVVMEACDAGREYAVLIFHGSYDIPKKASDKERLWESEEVYDYLICAVCPLAGEYEPGKPECGFLFPAFTDRSSDMNHIIVFQADPKRPHRELTENILNVGQDKYQKEGK